MRREHLADKPRRRPAIRRRLVGPLGSDTDPREQVVAEIEHLDHPPVYGLDVGGRKIPATDARLVREEKQCRAGLAGPLQRLAHPRQKRHALR
jgi:hypothetical protein